LVKGKQVYVEGRIQTRSYDKKEGKKVYVTEVVADDVILLGGQGEGHSAGSANGQARASAPSGAPRSSGPSGAAVHQEEYMGITDDDVPF
jgi:single-strand DNA-binding protein